MVKKIELTLFLDGRPGHEKQSRGIATALGNLATIEKYREIEVAKKGLFSTILGALALRFRGSTSSPGEVAKIYIGTGRHTHLPLLRAARRDGGKGFCAMLPGPLLRSLFSGCFVPEHDRQVRANNIFRTCGPPIALEDEGKHDDTCGLILVGGVDLKSHIWNEELLYRQIEELVAKEESRRWVVSSSPRTPQSTVQRLEKLGQQYANLEFFHYQDTPRGWVEERYHESGMVWVTADSISMVFEALAAGCKVGLLPVAWRQSESKFQRSENFLLEQNYLLSFEQWQRGEEWPKEKSFVNQAQWCAEKILEQV